MNTPTAGIATFRVFALLLAAILLLAVPPVASAEEPVGRIIGSTGRVMAVDANGFERTLTRNDVVFPGDRIDTGPKGRVQIRFEDQGLVDLKPESRFEIEEFRQRAGGGGSAVFNFVRGALRTISGLIGDDEEDEYRMNTPVATVGIRGTEYGLQYCGSDCAGNDRRPGLYGKVTSDSVTVSNDFGSGEFSEGQFFFTPPDGPPQLLLTPPGGVLDGSEDGETGEEEEDEEETSGEEEGGTLPGPGDDEDGIVESTNGEDLLDLSGDDFESGDTTLEKSDTTEETWHSAGSAGFDSTLGQGFGLANLVGPEVEETSSGANLTGQRFVTDADGNLTNIRYDFSDGSHTELDFSGMTLEQSGSDFGVDWGLLSGSWVLSGDDGSGTGFEFNMDTGGVAFSSTSDFTTPEQLGQLSGSASYSMAAGPDAIDAFGNLWDVNQLDISVNFTDDQADLTGFKITDGTDILQSSGTQALILDTSQGVLFVDPASPLVGSWSGVNGSGSAEIVLAGFFVGDDGSVINVSFTADQLLNSSPINHISGLKLLEAQ